MRYNPTMSRRSVLKGAALGMAGTVLTGAPPRVHQIFAETPDRGDAQRLEKVQLGLVADVHQDIIHDGYARIRTFVNEMNERSPHAVLQLGDFALPQKRNQQFLDTWNAFEGPRYHVLGNHDMRDLGYTREQTMDWWEMPKRYYSFDIGGWHFVVLDGNDQNPGDWGGGYVRYVNQEQRDWLRDDLANTNSPTILFSHQQLESNDGIANSGEVRSVLQEANQTGERKKVIACLCGHHHTDKMTDIAGIKYIHINSMSYVWVGSKHQRNRFPVHIDGAFPNLKNTVPFRDPLYTMLTLDPESETLQLDGMETQFVSPTPAEMKLENAEALKSMISQRKIKVGIA